MLEVLEEDIEKRRHYRAPFDERYAKFSTVRARVLILIEHVTCFHLSMC